MTEKLRDYQVLDVLCGGTFYKVRHKVTSKIFAWKAYNCCDYTDEQVKRFVSDVKTISKVETSNLLRYYDTIIHAPSKTLYFILEYNSWRSLDELIAECRENDKFIAETFIWYLLHELAGLCKAVEPLQLLSLKKSISTTSIFVDESGELRVNCFDLSPSSEEVPDLMRQVGDVIYTLCYRIGVCENKIKEFHYTNDLQDVVSFLIDERNGYLRPDIVLYHPTVLANLETLAGPKNLSEILIPAASFIANAESNKSDAEKAVELCKSLEPAARLSGRASIAPDSPIYCNVSPKRAIKSTESNHSPLPQLSVSPTVAALALELPGFVPRSRKPYAEVLDSCNSPQRVTENTLSQQWMSRLIALRQREESLNQRERDIIAKEILSSPSGKVIPLCDGVDLSSEEDKPDPNLNGITLPPHLPPCKAEATNWVTQRRSRRSRSSSIKTRSKNRKSYAYEDLDSSLSADQGDGSVIITAKKITKDNMPRRSIFPDVSTKKVHFTSSNPFTESDESVTLTFYELDNVDGEGYQVPKSQEKFLDDITKFKYLDLEKATSEKRSAMQQYHSSPSKQAKMTKSVLADITNKDGIKRTPSKVSIFSKTSNTSSGSHYSTASSKSQWSMSSAKSKLNEVSSRTRASMRQSIAPSVPATEVKKPKSRMSLLPFKTPFKFMSSTRI